MNIQNHLLQGVPFVATKNISGRFKKGLPDTVVIHYTAGPSALSAINTFKNPGSSASAHLVIDRDGSITQMVPFDTIAWHAGTSRWKGRSGLNAYSIGIELVNAGILTKVGTHFEAWFNAKYDHKDVVQARHRNQTALSWWHKYTPEQIKACEAVVALLLKTYGIDSILGHEEISPGRKIDPGPAFPLDTFREKLLKKTPLKNLNVAASSLNIRSGPSQNDKPVAAPLTQGQPVTVLEENGNWVKVRTTAVVEGWVSKRYLSDDQ